MDKAMVVQMKLKADEFLKSMKDCENSVRNIDSQVTSFKRGLGELRAIGVAALGYLGAGGAAELVKLGAKAKQSEESFRMVAKSANESADGIVSAMEKATAGTVDASDLMQKATKGMMLGLSGVDMTKIAEMARQSARTLGIDVSAAFDRITDSISTNMPRALKQMGLITKEQMDVMNKAISAGVENVDLLSVAYANFQTQEKKMGPLLTNEAEQLQILSAHWNDFKETIGTAMTGVIYGLLHPIDFVTKSLKNQSDQIEQSIDDINRLNEVATARGFITKPEEMGVPFRGKITGAPQYTEPSEFDRYKSKGQIKTPVDQMMERLKAETFKAQTDFDALVKEGIIGAGEVPTLIERFAGKDKDWKKYIDARKADFKVMQEHAKLIEQATNKMQESQIPEYEAPTDKQILQMNTRSQEIVNRQEEALAKQLEERAKLEQAATERSFETRKALGLEYEVATEEQQAAMAVRTIERENKTAEESMRFWRELSASTAEAMEKNFSSFFLDVMQGKLTSFADFAKGIFQSIQKAAADYLGMIATDFLFGKENKKEGRAGGILSGLFGGGLGEETGGKSGGGLGDLLGSVGGIFGGIFGHKGGIVGDTLKPNILMSESLISKAPRLHSGLAGDEFPAILQRGESVIPAGATNGGGGQLFNININAVDSKSFGELAARNPQAIVGPFITALNKGGQLRGALREAT